MDQVRYELGTKAWCRNSDHIWCVRDLCWDRRTFVTEPAHRGYGSNHKVSPGMTFTFGGLEKSRPLPAYIPLWRRPYPRCSWQCRVFL